MRVFIDNGIFVDASTFRSQGEEESDIAGGGGGVKMCCVEGNGGPCWQSAAFTLTHTYHILTMRTEDWQRT